MPSKKESYGHFNFLNMNDPVLGQARGTVHRFQSMDDLHKEGPSLEVCEEDIGPVQDGIH